MSRPCIGPFSTFSALACLATIAGSALAHHSTTVFDFVRRAMPFNQPRTLSNDEVYALTAYLLNLNKVIGDAEVMNAETLPKVKMPNRDNFIIRFPDRI